MSGEEVKIYRILPNLIMRGRFDSWPLDKKLRELQADRIDCVLSLVNEDAELSKVLGERYRCVPLSDGKTVPIARVNDACQYVKEWLTEGHTVLVHCNAGRNRSGLVVTLVVADIIGCSTSEALRRVREVRPRAVGSNPCFERFLLENEYNKTR